MICQKYQELNPIERVRLIGKIVHALQSNNIIFSCVVEMVEVAEKHGIFDNVKILPENEKKEEV